MAVTLREITDVNREAVLALRLAPDEAPSMTGRGFAMKTVINAL
jgi:hypothetical protein